MDTLNCLYLALDEKMSSQVFYNELSIKVTNPAAKALFTRLRDEETAAIEMLQQKIAAIEVKPFPINKILPGIKI